MLNSRIKDEAPWYDGSLLKCGTNNFHLISKDKSNATTYLHCGSKVVASKNQTATVSVITKWTYTQYADATKINTASYDYSHTTDLMQTGLYDALTISRKWLSGKNNIDGFFIINNFRQGSGYAVNTFIVSKNVITNINKNNVTYCVDKYKTSTEIIEGSNEKTNKSNDIYTVKYAGKSISVTDMVTNVDIYNWKSKTIKVTI